MGNKLLLADDSITIQKVVGIIFANEDYDLTVVDNGTAALEKARDLVPDIILIDALMPGKNGYEVCEEVRRDPVLSHVPLLLLTGAFEPFDEERARQCGADDFISKPFESQHLIDKVRALIELGKERAKIQQEPAPTAPLPEQAGVAGAAALEMLSVQEVSVSEPAVGEASGDIFTVEEVRGDDFFATDLEAAEEVVEVSSEEDLWGAFDVEEVQEDEAFAFEEIAETAPAATGSGLTAEEEFFFAEEEPGPTETGAEHVAAPLEFIPPGEPAAGDIFSFAEEPVQFGTGEAEEGIFTFAEEAPGAAGAGAEAFAAPQEFIPSEEPATEDFFSFAEDTYGTATEPDAVSGGDVFGVDSGDLVPGLETTEEFLASAAESQPASEVKEDVWPQAVEGSPEVKQQLVPEEEKVMAFNVPPVTAAEAAPSPATGEVTLSDAQLTALVARISRDVLEKIAWEVVPDLAETIIREEIRKIKECQ